MVSDVRAVASQYSSRLNAIQEELALVRASVRYVSANLSVESIVRIPEFAPTKRSAFAKIERRLEATYFIRLTAEFEGILKDHLRSYYPTVVIPANANFDWLMSRVFRPKKIIQPVFRAQIEEIRQYRNALAHGGEAVVSITFAIALSRLNILLSLLPPI